MNQKASAVKPALIYGFGNGDRLHLAVIVIDNTMRVYDLRSETSWFICDVDGWHSDPQAVSLEYRMLSDIDLAFLIERVFALLRMLKPSRQRRRATGMISSARTFKHGAAAHLLFGGTTKGLIAKLDAMVAA